MILACKRNSDLASASREIYNRACASPCQQKKSGELAGLPAVRDRHTLLVFCRDFYRLWTRSTVIGDAHRFGV